MVNGQPSAAAEWKANWGVVAAGLMGMALLTIPSVTLGLFIEPLEKEFGWSRTEISFGMTIFALITTPLAPFAGALADRFGSRKIAVPGSLLNALALAAFGLITGYYWQFVLAWVFYALSQLFIRTIIWNRAASASFAKSLGLALAVMMGGIPLAQTLAPIAAQWLIGDYGWRNAYISLGLGWGGLTFLVSFFLFKEAGDRAKGKQADQAPAPAAASGLTFGEAMRQVRIWRIALAITLQSGLASALSIHIFPLLTESGLTRETAASVVALLGIAALCGQFLTGFLADRVTSTLLPMSCFILPAVAITLLLQSGGTIAILALSVVFLGYALSSCVTITTYLTSRYGGTRHFGKIYGIMSSCMGLGAGLGPLLAGYIFDLTGTYDLFLMVGIVVAVVNTLLVFRLGRYPDFAAAA